jgi:hypothetical protein
MNVILLLFALVSRGAPIDASRAFRLRVFLRVLAYARHALRCEIAREHSKMLATLLSVENSSVMPNRTNDPEHNHRAEHRDDNERSNVFRKDMPNVREQLPEILTEEKQQQKCANEQCGNHSSSSLIIDNRIAFVWRFVARFFAFYQIGTRFNFYVNPQFVISANENDSPQKSVSRNYFCAFSVKPKHRECVDHRKKIIRAIYDCTSHVISSLKNIANFRLFIQIIHSRFIPKAAIRVKVT